MLYSSETESVRNKEGQEGGELSQRPRHETEAQDEHVWCDGKIKSNQGCFFCTAID